MHSRKTRYTFPGRLMPLVVVAVSACGGGGTSTTTNTNDTTTNTNSPTRVSESQTYPTGLAVGSPADVSDGTSTLAAVNEPVSGIRFALDWSRAVWDAIQRSDRSALARLASFAVPVNPAHAAAGGHGMVAAADLLEKVLDGDATLTPPALGGLVKLRALFGDAAEANTNASCYGPSVLYEGHPNASGGVSPNGTLPSGDVGIWLADETTGSVTEPCVVAQLSRRVRGTKGQTQQALLMAAMMRRAVEASAGSLAMPSAGASTDLTTVFASRLSALGVAEANVVSATIGLNAGGTVYTYRLVLTNGGSGSTAKRGEMILRHTKGSSATVYSGVLQVSGFTADTDSAFGCEDEKFSDGKYRAASVTTVKYSRNLANVAFSTRQARYCGHPASMTAAGTDDGSEVASFTSGNELDPSASLPAGPTVNRGASRGWRGNFTRYAGDYHRGTGVGDFLLAWQAGSGDSHSRTLAAKGEMNMATGERTVNGYYAYGSPIDTPSASFVQLGMICNWAGPGNVHTPQLKFQSQKATRSATAPSFIRVGSDKITYAPTNSCDSPVTMRFDQNANSALEAGEGNSVTNALDGLSSGITTVNAEVVSRGWTKPSLY